MIDELNPDNLSLGKQVDYISVYTPSLLQGITRDTARQRMGLSSDDLPFTGFDLWNAYEVSWLDLKGKPIVATAKFQIPCTSQSIIESKSLKLYLNSYNQTQFKDYQDVVKTLEADLSIAAGAAVLVDLRLISDARRDTFGEIPGLCLDDQDVEIDCYMPRLEFLKADPGEAETVEHLYSHLLRSRCPVTGQPDWGSVFIQYRGKPINKAGLLKYIVSFREYQGFHEQCIERMFLDIFSQCWPRHLTVYARYLRRGGLDINPYRTNTQDELDDIRLLRQ